VDPLSCRRVRHLVSFRYEHSAKYVRLETYKCLNYEVTFHLLGDSTLWRDQL